MHMCVDASTDLSQVVLHPAVLSFCHRTEEGYAQPKAPVKGPQCGPIVGWCTQGADIQRRPSKTTVCKAAGDKRPAALIEQFGIGFWEPTVGPADREHSRLPVC